MFTFSVLMTSLSGQNSGKPNILFIAVDDLKPLLGCYGDTLAHTPNIDALAAKGSTFTHSYCQQAVCAPSRVSLMTSRYPDQTRVWDLQTMMRDMNPDIITLPQYLVSKGYRTTGTGKILDSRSVDSGMDTPSWSYSFRNAWDAKYYDEVAGKPAMYFYASDHAKDTIALLEAEANLMGIDKDSYVKERYFPAFENAEVPYDAYTDGAVANVGLELLEEAVASGKPFFLGVGFHRPHLPFNAPKKFWDLYRREDFIPAPFQEQAAGSPSIAYHNSEELRSYTGIPKEGVLPEALQLELIHAYYAATSYIDDLVGMLTRRLDELGVADQTIIVLWGDHGWHLGDHLLWCKHSNFEEATRAPLIIYNPGQDNAGAKCPSPVEFTDIAPTLLDLAGIEIPAYFEGQSLSGLMDDPLATIREGSLSQYPRGDKMGYSLRTERYRYTRWTSPDGTAYATELYDYLEDPNESINRVFYPEFADLVSRLDSIVVSRIEIPSTQLKISFRITGEKINGTYGPLEDVSVTMAGETRLTDTDGGLLYTHHQGRHAYRLERPGYKVRKDTLNIDRDTIVSLRMELEEPVFAVTIFASDKYSGKALINAALTLDADELKTDKSGKVVFHKESGEYTLTLQKNLYPVLEDTVKITGDSSLHYRLPASHATIKVRLKEGETPVNNAKVSLAVSEVFSNSLGISVFETLPTGETYHYLIEKAGYRETAGFVLLHTDTTIDSQMERITGLIQEKGVSRAKIWPNPAGDRLYIRSDENIQGENIEFIDGLGRLVMVLHHVNQERGLDISRLLPGFYWIRWETETGTRYLKLMKN